MPVLAIGEVDGLPYFVMPFVDGESLADWLRRVGSLPVDEALDIAIAVASALEHAHQRSIVHRDIKPENVLIPRGDEAATQLTDFGLQGQLLDESNLTRAGQISSARRSTIGAGTGAGKSAISRCGRLRVWNVVVRNAVHGTTPWKAESLPALMYGIVSEPVTFPATPPISDGLRRFLTACLDKDLMRRPVSPLRISSA